MIDCGYRLVDLNLSHAVFSAILISLALLIFSLRAAGYFTSLPRSGLFPRPRWEQYLVSLLHVTAKSEEKPRSWVQNSLLSPVVIAATT